MKQIKLQSSCILSVPLEIYGKDFTFIVNGEEFKTSRVISDLISPFISKIHSNDPAFDRFIINTKHRGDFSHILKLINFKSNNYPESELPFLLDVIEILNNDYIELEDIKRKQEITVDNVFDNFQQHEKYSKLYRPLFSEEIEFISSHFSEICEEKEEELTKLLIDTLYLILTNDKLQLKNEDQLLKFINELYSKDEEYSILYETVLFENVSSETVCEFIRIYNNDLMTRSTWQRLSVRLSKEIISINDKNSSDNDTKRYKEKILIRILFSKEKEFDRIINYIRKKTNDQIENEISITASSIYSDNENYQPRNVILFDDHRKWFESNEKSNNWLCIDFKDHRIIPTDYSIRSYPCSYNSHHPKSWIVECSNDNIKWEMVDEEKDFSYLNGNNYSHTFTMNHQKQTEFRYIRIRLTGPSWGNGDYLKFDSFEVYGQFI